MDETGLDENDINLVVQQAGVTRGKAVKALRRNEGDIVNGEYVDIGLGVCRDLFSTLYITTAIMELTM